jgi:hypothetical protein
MYDGETVVVLKTDFVADYTVVVLSCEGAVNVVGRGS